MNQQKELARTTAEANDWQDSAIRWSLDSLASWIRFAELKVTAMLAIAGILVSGLLDRLPVILQAVNTRCLPVGTTIVASLLIYACAQLGVIVTALFVLWPRLTPARPSLFYFGHIASMSYESYQDEYTHSAPEKLREHAMRQIHDNSRIAGQKFRGVRVCTILLGVSLLAWIVLMLLT